MSKFLVAYATLQAVRNNLPQGNPIKGYYVEEFHKALSGIKDVIGEENLNSFQVPQGEVAPRGMKGRNGEIKYGSETWCDKEKLLIKIDAVLNYLVLQSPPEEKTKIWGFQTEMSEQSEV